jgi:hypothetical protein
MTKVYIKVYGGMVQDVYSNDILLDVNVIDLDNLDSEDEEEIQETKISDEECNDMIKTGELQHVW